MSETHLDSGFLCKGLVYLGAFDFYERRIAGGKAAVAAALTDPALRAFAQHLFLASGKYDILPIVDISAAAASIAHVPHKELVIENAQWLARRDLKGVLKLLLKLTSPSSVAVRLPRVSMQYFSFGEAEGELQGERRMVARQRGVPAALTSWMMWAVEGFVPVVLGHAGAKTVRVHGGRTTEDAPRAGAPTVTLEWELDWDL
jgi:hypothetical protein